MNYQTPKGTHDFIEKEALLFEEVEYLFKSMAQLYAFQPIKTPIFEHSELFLRSVGESSDIVSKEMYTFIDKGQRSLTLRPELTAGTLRAIVNSKLDKTSAQPLKVYYSGPAFRYERPQLGRFRQFYQFGLELLGVHSYVNEVEVILWGYYALMNLGFKHVTIKINNLGDDHSREQYKLALKEFFKDKIDHMCPDCQHRYLNNPLRILDCKVPSDRLIIQDAPKITNYLSKPSIEHYQKVKESLLLFKVPFVETETLVRGLDYYSNIVFEYHLSDEVGATFDALGAGGYYEHLLSDLGGAKLNGIGLSLGIDRIISALNKLALVPDLNELVDVYVMPLSKQEIEYAFAMVMMLRNGGFRSELNTDGSNLKAQLKKANKVGARFALIIGEQEVNQGLVTIKDLDQQSQETLKYQDLLAYIGNLLDGHHHDHDHQCDHEHCQCHQGE